jgi:hypothetical protein
MWLVLRSALYTIHHSIAQKYLQQGLMNLYTAIEIKIRQLAKSVHEEVAATFFVHGPKKLPSRYAERSTSGDGSRRRHKRPRLGLHRLSSKKLFGETSRIVASLPAAETTVTLIYTQTGNSSPPFPDSSSRRKTRLLRIVIIIRLCCWGYASRRPRR